MYTYIIYYIWYICKKKKVREKGGKEEIRKEKSERIKKKQKKIKEKVERKRGK